VYDLDVTEEADRIFYKLSRKNKKQLEIIHKKIAEIRETPVGYKFLHRPLHGFNRVHIDTHFVLVFEINHERKLVTVHYFDHHDDVYKWRPRI